MTKLKKTLHCGYLQLHSTTSGELPVSSIASTPMFVYYNIRETGKQCKRRDSGEVVERQGARKSMLRAGVSCLEPHDYNYGNDDFESGFQGATGLTMRFRQPQAHGATAHGYGARIRKPTDTAHGYGARIRRMYRLFFCEFLCRSYESPRIRRTDTAHG